MGLAPQMFTRVTNLPGPARSGVTSDPFALSGARSVSPDGSSCGSLSAPLGGAKTSWRSCWKVRASVQDLWRVSDQERRSSARRYPTHGSLRRKRGSLGSGSIFLRTFVTSAHSRSGW